MKKTKILLCVAILLALIFLAFAVNALVGGNVSYNIDRYIALTENNKVLPKIDELRNYDDYYFKYFHDNMLIFESDSYILKVSYDAANYEKEKESLAQKYVYQTTPLVDRAETIIEKEPDFKIDGFDMKLLSMQEYGFDYPKELVFVGTSDEKKTISYVYYHNYDLDYIEESYEEFLRNKCKW